MDEALKKELYWGVPCILLLFALGRMPSWYYELLRLVIFVASIYCVVQHKNKTGTELYTILFSISAIIYNPIIPIYLYDKGLWMVINLLTMFLFAMGAYALKANSPAYRKRNPYSKSPKINENQLSEFDKDSLASDNEFDDDDFSEYVPDQDALNDLDDNDLQELRELKESKKEFKEMQRETMARVRRLCKEGIDFQLVVIARAISMETYEERVKLGEPVIPEYVKDGYIFGYIFGFHDGMHQSMRIKIDDIEYMGSCTVIIDHYLGSKGLENLGKSQSFETASESNVFAKLYKEGRYAARQDVTKARSGEPFMSLANHLIKIR